MKKYFKGLLLCMALMLLCLPEAYAGQEELFYSMTGAELKAVIEDAKVAEAAYHLTPSATQSVLRDLTEDKVEAYYAASGIEVSWPWFGYVYTRDWDFYTLSTHAKYKAGGRQEDPVYAEIFGYSTQPEVYYLEAGGTVLVDRRSEIPPTHRLADPGALINEETGTDFALLSGAELAELKSVATQELKASHTPKSVVTRQMKSMTQEMVEEYYKSAGKQASWPRLGYDFTCEWDLYTMTATVKAGGQKLPVLSEAFPVDNQYSIVYLEVDGEVVKDRRELILLPEKQNESAAATPAASSAARAAELTAPAATADPAAQGGTEVPVFMAPPTPGIDAPAATTAPLWTPEPTPEATPVPTPKPVPEGVHLEQDMEGDLVKKVQRRLKDIGYLAGEVDGYYGEITYWTVWIWQGDNGLPVTGEVNDAEMRLLFPEEYE